MWNQDRLQVNERVQTVQSHPTLILAEKTWYSKLDGNKCHEQSGLDLKW